jgi:sugar/nucleoside kinase (ribokinase family)
MRDYSEIIEILEKNKDIKHKVIVGFDGFVDEICDVVEERLTASTYRVVKTITDYSTKLGKYAGLSMNIEIVPTMIKLGGNAPIMANSLAELGNNINFIGAIGKDDIHPLFRDFAEKCINCFSLSDPGHTDALEFTDGKIMMGKIAPMDIITWDNILTKIGNEKLEKILQNTELVAFNNWTLIFGMNGIIEGFTEMLSKTKHFPYIYFDLSDPTKRDSQDIREALYYISQMQKVGKVVLGLNKNESELISRIIKKKEDNLAVRALMIKNSLGLHACIIHDIKGASSGFKNKGEWVDGPFTPKPRLSTGAGDNFNAGFCYGLLSGLTPEQALVTGVCTSGFYVREKRSPTNLELIDFIKSFVDNKIGD